MAWDKAEVAAAAAGRWREILLGLCSGINYEDLTGTHERPCPKCGGSTRFRPQDDFDQTGGLRCSHCFPDRNFDGFAAIQWYHNWNFAKALNEVAHFLHLPSSPMAGGSAAAGKRSKSNADQPQPQQKQQLGEKWKRWTVGDGQRMDLVSQWCKSRPPIAAESVIQSDVMIGNWPVNNKGQVCLGFWGYGEGPEPKALLLYRADGQQFPEFAKLHKRKTHLVGGSEASWVHIGGLERTKKADVIWRVEGMPDGLALLPLLPANHAVVTPSCGCGWNNKSPEKNPSLSLFVDKVLIGVGDADEPGQRGLMRFLKDASVMVTRTFFAVLPYAVEATHGKDLRDWISEGADFAAVQKTLVDFGRFTQQTADLFSAVDAEQPAGGELSNYVKFGKSLLPRPISEVMNELWMMTDGWPRRVNNSLFTHIGDSISWLQNASALCAWFGIRTGATVDFARDGGVFSKNELFEGLQQSAIQYRSVENQPHEPLLDGHYYTCGDYPDGDGEHLTWLLDRFCVEEQADRDLILLMMATVFWGGGGGQRPAFMITANGTGAGKTTLASVVAELAGGMLSVGQKEGAVDIVKRLLNAEGLDKRIVFIDNIKATRFSSADIEGLITLPIISGHKMYKGEGQRPNTLTWIMTMNGVGVSKDIAERVIVIKLKRPEYSGTWADETLAYVREHRREIISDILAFLRGPREKVARCTRWSTWDSNVVSRLALPDAAVKLIRARQHDVDVDGDEAALVQDFFRDRLEELRYSVSSELIFIPSAIVNQWHCLAFNERAGVTKTSRWLKTQIEQGALPHLVVSRIQNFRGFVWQGETARSDQEVLCDITHRLDMNKRTQNGFLNS